MSTADEIGSVIGLWRYPASSLGGERLDAAPLRADGVEGDRLFGIVDAATGVIAKPDSDRKWHPVPRIAARLDGGALEIKVPGGDWLPAPSEAADNAASSFLGFDARIRKFEEGTALEAPRYRKAPVHLLTTASLAELKAQHPGGDPDPRRFRPNIVVDMPPVAGHFPETEWLGRKITIGEVELEITDPCRRCGFTMLGQDGFEYDPDILRTLVRKNRHNLGVYCELTRPGTVRPGDTMRFLD
ncbi:MAG: MOSC domain-containing protein [Mesorhizobium sp.]|nr:MOSC domain-containing protein [Mesorhizobium sp.]MBL8577486.1 MOSC domain-containing protein [Mesorhizobium sp.]